MAGTTAWYLAVRWPPLEGTSPWSTPGSAETPVKAVWRRLTCCPARRCPSTVWMYSDNVLSVGLTERLFLSTDRSRFKRVVSVQDRICLFPVRTCFIVSFEHTVCPKYCVQKVFLCVFGVFLDHHSKHHSEYFKSAVLMYGWHWKLLK